MVKVIMHGCNGHMGQVITGLIKDDPEIEIVAGVDPVDCRDMTAEITDIRYLLIFGPAMCRQMQ